MLLHLGLHNSVIADSSPKDLRNNDDDRLNGTRRAASPRRNGARSSRDRDQGRHHPRVETDDDDAY